MNDQCETCGATFASWDARDDHRRRAHPSGRAAVRTRSTGARLAEDLTCPLCGERLASPAELTAHSLRPHYRSNLTIGRTAGYSSA
jgi:hypothetical protein